LPARLSFNADERSRFTAARVAGAAVGGLAAAGLTPVIAASLGGGLAGYAAAAAGLGALAAACLVISGLGVRESPDVPPVSVGQEGYAGALAELWRFARRTGPLQRLLSIMVAATLGFSIFSGALMFQIQSRPGWAAITPLLLAAPSLASLAAALLWPVAAERSSKRAALAAGALLAGAGFIAFGFADAAAFALAALAVTGAGLAAIPVMLWSMAADAVDYGQLNTGARVEARVFGLFTFLQKIATGLGALIIAAGLAAAGGAAAGAPVAPGWIITGLVSAVPAGFMVITAVIAAGYSIDRSAHAAIARTLSAGEEPPTR
jgi:GPH family glycoside/pentoside/hexuronide:cation symporter